MVVLKVLVQWKIYTIVSCKERIHRACAEESRTSFTKDKRRNKRKRRKKKQMKKKKKKLLTSFGATMDWPSNSMLETNKL